MKPLRYLCHVNLEIRKKKNLSGSSIIGKYMLSLLYIKTTGVVMDISIFAKKFSFKRITTVGCRKELERPFRTPQGWIMINGIV